MIDVRFAGEIWAQYRVYSLCCHALLNSYEELSVACRPSEGCHIEDLIEFFNTELRNSLFGDKYDLMVENADLFLQRLINQYCLNADAHERLTAIYQTVLDNASEWDFRPSLIGLRDIGQGLAQDFYREGGRATNVELIDSKVPTLVFSNLCLSETAPSGFTEPRPISTLSDEIHLPFTKDFKFCCYLSYPFLFFHEYVSHIYVPRIDSRRFDDGWLMYAIWLFIKTRWLELCEKYPLICAQMNVLDEVWRPRFMRLASKGYYLAFNVNLCIENDAFLRFTWDLASYSFDLMETPSFHDDFLDLIEQFTQKDKRRLLRSAAENSANALQLYENLKAKM